MCSSITSVSRLQHGPISQKVPFGLKNCLSAAVSVKCNLININLREEPGRRPFSSVQSAQLPPPLPQHAIWEPSGDSLTQDKHRRHRLSIPSVQTLLSRHAGFWESAPRTPPSARRGRSFNHGATSESWRKFDKGLLSASGIPPTQDLGSEERRGNDELERR